MGLFFVRLLKNINIYKVYMLYIKQMGNNNNIVNFLYYLFSFTPFLHNKTVVAMRPFFYFLRRVERGGAERTRRSGRPTERENESFRSEDTRSVFSCVTKC